MNKQISDDYTMYIYVYYMSILYIPINFYVMHTSYYVMILFFSNVLESG